MRTRLAIFLVAVSTAAPAQQLGTLFHSPKEREALERARRGESAWQAATPSADPVVTGFVKRSDGKSTVFIDKRPYPARDPRMQGVLDPRIVERYEPIPLPPAPPPRATEPGNGAPPEPARKDAPKRTAGSKEE